MGDEKAEQKHMDPLTMKVLANHERRNGYQDGGSGVPQAPLPTSGFVKLEGNKDFPRTRGGGEMIVVDGSSGCNPQDGVCGCGQCQPPSQAGQTRFDTQRNPDGYQDGHSYTQAERNRRAACHNVGPQDSLDKGR